MHEIELQGIDLSKNTRGQYVFEVSRLINFINYSCEA